MNSIYSLWNDNIQSFKQKNNEAQCNEASTPVFDSDWTSVSVPQTSEFTRIGRQFQALSANRYTAGINSKRNHKKHRKLNLTTDYYCTRCLSSCFRKVNLCSRFSLWSRIVLVIFRNITYVALTKNMADTCVRLASRPGLCQTCIGFRLG